VFRRLFAIILALVWTLIGSGATTFGDDLVASGGSVSPSGKAHVVIVCGLAGDDMHRETFTKLFSDLLEGLETKVGVPRENITVLYGEPELSKKLVEKGPSPPPESSADAATENPPEGGTATSAKFDLSKVNIVFDTDKEKITAAGQELAQRVGPDDSLWVIVLGHAHYDGRWSNLNLPGPDMSTVEFAKAFADVRCQRQVFFMTTAVSGYFLRPLARPGRAVISATEADLEVNEPIFAMKLAERLKALEETPDADSDGNVTMLDLYVGVARDVASQYEGDKHLATEHSLIEDTGDNRPSELQAWYLPEKLGGRRREGDAIPKLDPKQDGFFSSQWFLTKFVAPPPAPEAKTEPVTTEPKPDESKPESESKSDDAKETTTEPAKAEDSKAETPSADEKPAEAAKDSK
jgi:hypothetical protein